MSIRTKCILLIFLLIIGCNYKKEQVLKQQIRFVKIISQNINSELEKNRFIIKSVSDSIIELYSKKELKGIKNIHSNDYQLSKNGIYYRKIYNKNQSAVFVTAGKKITPELINTIHCTESIEKYFYRIINTNKEIKQIYFIDSNSYVRIYPPIDVLIQLSPELDITDFNFYYLADAVHNPLKQTVWIDKPYVDPAGKGWMVSVLSPIYYNNVLQGVTGMDITTESIIKFCDSLNDLIIIDKEGTIVEAKGQATSILSLPFPEKYKYSSNITKNIERKSDYNISQSKSKSVRYLTSLFLTIKNDTIIPVKIEKKEYIIIASPIKEVNWKLLSIMKIKNK